MVVGMELVAKGFVGDDISRSSMKPNDRPIPETLEEIDRVSCQPNVLELRSNRNVAWSMDRNERFELCLAVSDGWSRANHSSR